MCIFKEFCMDFLIALVLVVVVVGAIIFISGFKIIPQSEVWVIERLGSFRGVESSGLKFFVPVIDKVRNKVPMRELTYDVPPQTVITKDNVSITADSFMFFNVFDAQKYTYGVQNVGNALNALAVSALRGIIGNMELEECLRSRDSINRTMTVELDKATDKWGIKVSRVEVKNFMPPRDIQDSMERQMKADRERREQIIRAEAEKASAILDAEKEKSVQVLRAEAAKEAAQLNAEANKIAVVQKAEAEKEAALIRADAEKAVRIKQAEAQAEAIRAINAAAPSEAYLRLKSYESFIAAANGQATKIIVPSDMQGIVSAATAAKEAFMSHR